MASAMSLSRSPAATRDSTCRSRSDSRLFTPRVEFSRNDASAGETYVLPAAISRTARRMSAPSASFDRYPRAPAEMAPSTSSCPACAETMSTLCPISTTFCTAAESVTPRSFRSSTTTVPAGSRAAANRGTESATVPSSMSAASASTRATADRYNGWSSITLTRIRGCSLIPASSPRPPGDTPPAPADSSAPGPPVAISTGRKSDGPVYSVPGIKERRRS